jgi:valyl-tRNA synthetase
MSADLIKYWEEKKIYQYQTHSEKEIFSIDTPPPTISGLLHIGHVFSYAHTDFIARFQRMNDKNVFYPIGFDCNGLPTEKLVEKTFNKRAKDYENNEDFKKKCEETIDNSIPQFEDLFKKIGLSIDFNLRYNTIDNRSQKIAINSFINLYKKNEIYEDYKPVFWDWIDSTAISQAEIEDKEFEGEMHDIIFKQENGDDLVISTTRPEMIYGCFCIFIHPEDLERNGRYSHLKNSYVYTPLYNKKVPILADEDTIKDKGTGAMMCCPFGDELDLKRYEKYSLKNETKEIFQPLKKMFEMNQFVIQDNGTINSHAVKILSNYDNEKKYKIEEFRKLLVEELKANNFIIKSTKVTQIVKCAERSGCKLEIIPKMQWYIRTLNHKNKLLEASKKINWLPKEMFEKIRVWIESLRHDWCISRQRYWGIKFPIKYLFSQKKNIENQIIFWDFLNEKSENEEFLNFYNEYYEKIENNIFKVIKNFKYRENEFEIGDEFKLEESGHVFDTWFTSSLTPQINNLYNQTFSTKNALEKAFSSSFATMDLRPQAHEIIRTWAFGTITQSFLNYGENYQPWKNIMISGWCLAKDGGKMSKSKGNIIDPNKLIDQYGPDVVRYWAANSNLGGDTRFDENIMKIGKKLVTKLSNVIKFAELFLKLKNIKIDSEEEIENFSLKDFQARNIAKIRCAPKTKCILHHHDRDSIDLSLINELMDIWIIKKFYFVCSKMTEMLENFDYFRALQILEEFFWKDYCDNYIEICKVRAYGEKTEVLDSQHLSALTTLAFISLNILKLFAIYLPFTTEKLYLEFAYQEISVHSKWVNLKEFEQFTHFHFAENGEILIDILNEVRKYKTQNQLSIKDEIDLKIFYTKDEFVNIFEQISFDLKNVANIKNLENQKITNDDRYDIKINEYIFLKFL